MRTNELRRMDEMLKEHNEVVKERQRQQNHLESVRGKHTPYRMEYRFGGSIRHYEYFLTPEDARNFLYKRVRYPLIGLTPYLEWPSSWQLQKLGPRGGWSKYKEDAK